MASSGCQAVSPAAAIAWQRCKPGCIIADKHHHDEPFKPQRARPTALVCRLAGPSSHHARRTTPGTPFPSTSKPCSASRSSGARKERRRGCGRDGGFVPVLADLFVYNSGWVAWHELRRTLFEAAIRSTTCLLTKSSCTRLWCLWCLW